MKTKWLSLCLALAFTGALTLPAAEPQVVISNPLIRYDLFAANVMQVGEVREGRRLTEADFLKMMNEPGVVLLDARSGPMFKLRHLQGAVNLSLPDFSEAALAKVIPSKDTKILIYCNNNFTGSPVSMVAKSAPASLNVHTFVTLKSYGYEQVWELGPLLDVHTTRLPMAGDEVEAVKSN
jgi:rhodanese-related sulfurtransferase